MKSRLYVLVILQLLCSVFLKAQNTADVVFNLENNSVKRYIDDANLYYGDVYTHSTIVSRYVSSDPDARDDMGAEVIINIPEEYSRPLYLCCTKGNSNEQIVFSKNIDTDDSQVGIPNLVPGTTYAYTIADNNGDIVYQGQIQAKGRVRMLRCPSIFNVRDMGGWNTASGHPLKYEMLYRGSELRGNQCYATAEDVATLRSLGICAELDFRDEATASIQGGKSWLGEDCPYLHINMNDTGMQYAENKEDYARAFRFILDNMRNGCPTYIHCTYGADRTGMFCALLEALAGVSLADIYKEYELTSFSFIAKQRTKLNLNRRLYYLENTFPLSRPINDVMNDYALNDIGITEQELEEFRVLMLENGDMPTGIDQASVSDSQMGSVDIKGKDFVDEINVYSLDGLTKKNASRGLNLVRHCDGRIYKVVVTR